MRYASHRQTNRWHRYLVLALLFGTTGIYLSTVGAQAAGSWIRIEAENATVSGQISVVSDSTASNGGAITITSNSSSGFVLPNPGTWTNATSTLANMSSECGNLTMLFANPQQNTMIAGVAARGLWSTANNGASWSHLGDGAGSAIVNNRVTKIVFDPTNSGTFWEAGIYGDGVFKTSNNGLTFQRLGTISHVDDLSIDFTDPNRQVMVATGHEQTSTIYKSVDGGANWTNIGATFPTNTDISSGVHVINSQTYIVNVAQYSGGAFGMYRTTNGGQSWGKVTDIAGRGQHGFIVSPNGTLFITTWGGLARSTDGGNSWSEIGGLRSLVPAVLPDSRVVSISGNRLVVSSDNGNTWTQFGATTPYDDMWGVAADTSTSSIYVWRWDCGNIVPSNAVMRLK